MHKYNKFALSVVIALLFTISLPALANTDIAKRILPAIMFLLLESDEEDMSTLNDTGITFGGDFPLGNNSGCTGDTIAQQDCSHGRDATNNHGSDGHAGFSFTKLDINGNDLAASASQWSCVRDNVTGLIWEKKIDDGSEQDKDNTYEWGGLTALGRDHPNRQGTYFDDWNSLVNHANNINLCGFNDWRVPEREELRSIVNYGTFNPSIDVNYFPNTVGNFYWSSSPLANNSGGAWVVNFFNGSGNAFFRSSSSRVRLVR